MDASPSNGSPTARVLDRVDVRAAALTIFGAAASLYVAREGAGLLAPILVSVLLAYAIEPFVALACRSRIPRPVAAVVVYAMLVAGFIVTARVAQRQFVSFVDALPATVEDIRASVDRAGVERRSSGEPGTMGQLQTAATEFSRAIGAPLRPAREVARVLPVNRGFDVRRYLADSSMAVARTSARLVSIALLTLLLVLHGEALKRKLIAIAGPRAQKKITHDVIKAIDRQIERYLVARLLISATVAAATWFGLWCLGVREPLVLGLIAGVLNVMPLVGPAAAVALVALVAFVQFHTVAMTAAAVCVAGAVAALEGNLISPWLTGRAGELNTVAVFVAVLFWGWMWDVWGLLLAIPIVVAIKAAADHIEPLQPLGELLGR
ncbi:MAG: AI-2E family transporter [Vicinamibacterales bacterium]